MSITDQAVIHRIRFLWLQTGQVICCVASAVLFLWACWGDRFIDAEGFPLTGFCLPLSISVGLLLVAVPLAGRWCRFRASALWLALGLVGQAVFLQMIDAGKNVSYQHLRPLSVLLSEPYRYLLLFVLAQVAVVAWGLRRIGPRLGRWITHNLKHWPLVCLAAVFFLSSATKINVRVSTYLSELVLATFLQLVNLATVVLAVAAFPREYTGCWSRWLDGCLSAARSTARGRGRHVDRFSLLAALWVTLFASFLGVYSYERHPHIPDEVVYLWHARYFAQGHLTLPAPPIPEAFDLYLAELDGGRWYSPVPPGWPAVLAIGVWFGVPWLVNPLLAGITVIGIYVLLQELYDRRQARIAVLLICVSPWYLFMAMNLMTHTLTLACAVAAALGVAWSRKTNRAVWAWLGGAALGFISLVRPLEGLAMAGLLGLWAIGVGGRRLKGTAIAGLVFGAVMVGSVVGPYNKALTGRATEFPLMKYVDKHFGPGKLSLGFGPEKGLGWRGVDPFPGHGALDVAMNAHLNVHSLNTELHGWSIGSLLLVGLAVFGGKMSRPDRLMLAVIIVIVGIHSFFWYSGGPDFGARYWYLIFVPCIALSVRGLDFLTERSGAVGSTAALRPLVAVLALCLLTLVNFFPWRAIDKYHHFRNMRPDMRTLAKKYGFGPSLVLIRGNNHDDYASAFAYNPVDLQADAPIYAWDRSPEVRTRLLQIYKDRPIWLVDGASLTQGPFEVVAGPLSAADAAARSIP